MSGHSKWHSIKHKKGAADAARGKLFAVLIRQIEIAARTGGGDPTSNATLRSMIQKARDNSLPVDTIQRAIKRGSGEEEGVIYEQVSYEGYARERRRGDRAGAHRQSQSHVGGDQEHLQPQRRLVRRARCGVVAVRAQGHRAGRSRRPTRTSSRSPPPTPAPKTCEDLGDHWQVTTPPTELHAVRTAIEEAGITVKSSDLTMIPTTSVALDQEAPAKSVLRLMDALEEHDDVEAVYANFDIPDAVLEAVSA